MSLKLISRNERYPIETEYIMEYKISVETPRNSLAKMPETKNEMIVTLEVPKSEYKNDINVQTILQWAEMSVNDQDYFRDLAVHFENDKGLNERSIVFTHAKITLEEYGNVKEDFVTIKMTVNQRRDKFTGVMFGINLDDTYKRAWERANNPPTVNIVIPPNEGDTKEFAYGPIVPNADEMLKMLPLIPQLSVKEFSVDENRISDFDDLVYTKDSVKVEYQIRTSKAWIYNNYPEKISKEMLDEFGQGVYQCINKQKVTGEVQIFYSHYNESGENINYGIRVYSLSGEVKLTVTNYCYAKNDDEKTGCSMWETFFNKFKKDDAFQTDDNGNLMLSKTPQWLFIQRDINLKKNGVFSGNIRLTLTAEAVIELYIFRDNDEVTIESKKIDTDNLSDEDIYPYKFSQKIGEKDMKFEDFKVYTNEEGEEVDDRSLPEASPFKMYTGLGEGYMYNTNPILIYASDCMEKGISFPTHFRAPRPKENDESYKFDIEDLSRSVRKYKDTDLIPIHIVKTDKQGVIKVAGSDGYNNYKMPFHNVGNWCAQYLLNVVLINDIEKDIVFKGYIKLNNTNEADYNPVIIQYGQEVKHTILAGSKSDEYPERRKGWNWLQKLVSPIKDVKHNKSDAEIGVPVSHQFILGTNASIGMQHIWKAVDVKEIDEKDLFPPIV